MPTSLNWRSTIPRCGEELQLLSRRLWRQALYEYPLALITGLFLAGIALVFLGERYFTEREERRLVAYSEHLMQTFIAQRASEFGKIARDYAVWDAMAEHNRGTAEDIDWLTENVTASVYSELDVDDVLILDTNLRPLYALRRGEHVRVERLGDWDEQLAMLLTVSTARHPERHTLAGVVRAKAALRQVVAERIRPELKDARARDPSGWVVFAREISPKWLDEISELLSISALVVLDAPPQGNGPHYALRGTDADPVGWLTWQINREYGHGGAIVPLLLGLSALFGFVTLIAKAVLGMHRREIETHARMLRQSETLRHLARLPQNGDTDSDLFAEIAQAVRLTLEVARVSLWRADSGRFVCVAASGATVGGAAALEIPPNAAFFDALLEARTLATGKPGDATRLADRPSDTGGPPARSALDAAVMIRGRLAGWLRIEESDRRRSWQPDQISFAGGVADQIAMAFESAERRNIEAAFTRQQNFDTLTGLANAGRLSQVLRQHLQQPGARVVYSLWQLSGLFHVNEEYGQACGDAVLQEMAHRFEQTPRLLCAARLSGTRFALIVPDLAAHEVAQDIGAVLRRLQQPVRLGQHQISLQLNCGVSLAPQDARTSEELLRHAEFALEAARASATSCVEYYAPEDNAIARERHQLAYALPAALANDEFVVHFQPLIDLASGEIVAAEALVRWQHPRRGLIRPDLFIALAEENGHIADLGRFVLERALACQAQWMQQTGREIVMAVNVSSLQLHDAQFIPFVERLLRQHALPPRLLDLEITESRSIELFEQAPETVAQLHRLGIGLSIDDFGTGYSSLSYLRHLPARKLKIDRSFIERVPAEQYDADLARMIIGLGKILDMTIVAEGIETQEQLDFLRQHGCDLGQGYWFSRPVDAATFARLLGGD